MLNSIVARLATMVEDVRVQEDGQSLVEWALILALISVISIGVLQAIGLDVLGTLQDVDNAIA